MAVINFILCVTALGAALFAFASNKLNVWLIMLSYISFALSPLTDFLDIISRSKADDTGGILDIYPTFFVCYLILLAAITAINAVNILVKAKRSAK